MTTTAPGAVEIQGRTLTFPVEVRRATSWSAQFLVPAGPTRRLLDGTGLEPAEPVPGRALLALAAVAYEDTDLDAYHEVAVSFLVRHPGTPRGSALGRAAEVARRQVGVYIRHLPVDQTFTLEAGRRIWGYPKTLARIDIDGDGSATSVRLEQDGVHVLTLGLRGGGRLALPVPALPTYTATDGVLRRTEWETSGDGVTGRVGGATVALGDHPIADELRAVGLPRRAVTTGSVRHVRARFSPAVELGPCPGG